MSAKAKSRKQLVPLLVRILVCEHRLVRTSFREELARIDAAVSKFEMTRVEPRVEVLEDEMTQELVDFHLTNNAVYQAHATLAVMRQRFEDPDAVDVLSRSDAAGLVRKFAITQKLQSPALGLINRFVAVFPICASTRDVPPNVIEDMYDAFCRGVMIKLDGLFEDVAGDFVHIAAQVFARCQPVNPDANREEQRVASNQFVAEYMQWGDVYVHTDVLPVHVKGGHEDRFSVEPDSVPVDESLVELEPERSSKYGMTKAKQQKNRELRKKATALRRASTSKKEKKEKEKKKAKKGKKKEEKSKKKEDLVTKVRRNSAQKKVRRHRSRLAARGAVMSEPLSMDE